jgi:hypothetical protein
LTAGCGGGGGDGDGGQTDAGQTTATDGGETTAEQNAAAGEGGGGDGGNDDGGSLTKAQYIQQGDAICQKVPTAYQGLFEQLPKAQQENPRQSVPKAAIPPLKTAIGEFETLGAPAGEDAKAAEIIAAFEKAIAGLEQNPMGELAGPNSSFAEFSELTQQYGFQVCPGL